MVLLWFGGVREMIRAQAVLAKLALRRPNPQATLHYPAIPANLQKAWENLSCYREQKPEAIL